MDTIILDNNAKEEETFKLVQNYEKGKWCKLTQEGVEEVFYIYTHKNGLIAIDPKNKTSTIKSLDSLYSRSFDIPYNLRFTKLGRAVIKGIMENV